MSLGLPFWISVIALLLALFLGSRFLLQFFVYHLYRPYVFVSGHTPNFRNESNRHLTAEIEFISDSIIETKNDSGYIFPLENLAMEPGGGMRYKSTEVDLTPGTSFAPAGPFSPESGTEVQIMIHPYIEASELGLPAYYGKFRLKPISQSFTYEEEHFIPDSDNYPPPEDLFDGINHKLQWRIVSFVRRVI